MLIIWKGPMLTPKHIRSSEVPALQWKEKLNIKTTGNWPDFDG